MDFFEIFKRIVDNIKINFFNFIFIENFNKFELYSFFNVC